MRRLFSPTQLGAPSLFSSPTPIAVHTEDDWNTDSTCVRRLPVRWPPCADVPRFSCVVQAGNGRLRTQQSRHVPRTGSTCVYRVSFCPLFSPQRLSKTLAERRAWEITEVCGAPAPLSAVQCAKTSLSLTHTPSLPVQTAPFDLVVINPSFVLGPAFSSRTDSTSVRALKGLLEGAMKDGARPAGFGRGSPVFSAPNRHRVVHPLLRHR